MRNEGPGFIREADHPRHPLRGSLKGVDGSRILPRERRVEHAGAPERGKRPETGRPEAKGRRERRKRLPKRLGQDFRRCGVPEETQRDVQVLFRDDPRLSGGQTDGEFRSGPRQVPTSVRWERQRNEQPRRAHRSLEAKPGSPTSPFP